MLRSTLLLDCPLASTLKTLPSIGFLLTCVITCVIGSFPPLLFHRHIHLQFELQDITHTHSNVRWKDQLCIFDPTKMTEREAKARGCRGETVTIWHSNTRDNDKVCARTKKIYGKNFCIVTEKGGEGEKGKRAAASQLLAPPPSNGIVFFCIMAFSREASVGGEQ